MSSDCPIKIWTNSDVIHSLKRGESTFGLKAPRTVVELSLWQAKISEHFEKFYRSCTQKAGRAVCDRADKFYHDRFNRQTPHQQGVLSENSKPEQTLLQEIHKFMRK